MSHLLSIRYFLNFYKKEKDETNGKTNELKSNKAIIEILFWSYNITYK